MLKLIKEKLLQIVSDIDAGNSNIDEEDAVKLVRIVNEMTDKTVKLSKYQACQMLNCSRATFDNLIREGKLSKGKKEAGFKEIFWVRKDIEEFIKKNK